MAFHNVQRYGSLKCSFTDVIFFFWQLCSNSPDNNDTISFKFYEKIYPIIFVLFLISSQHQTNNRADGTFKVSGIPSGSYVVEIVNPTYVFEPARVDITTKGKIRARKLNNVQSTAVVTVPYPLRMKTKLKAGYFQQREEFSVTDMLKNPMVSLVPWFLVLKMMYKLLEWVRLCHLGI